MPKLYKTKSISGDLDETEDYDVTRDERFQAGLKAIPRLLRRHGGTLFYGRIAREIPDCTRFLDEILSYLSSEGKIEYNPLSPAPSKVILRRVVRARRHNHTWRESSDRLHTPSALQR